MKDVFFENIKQKLVASQFRIDSYDANRPWGGFFVLDESQAQEFADTYFDGLDVSQLKISGKLSPKILVVAPHQRLSWQYHHRRAEIWKVIEGEAGVVRSSDDTEGKLEVLGKGDLITLQQGERHRLIGLEDWAVIAEIWQHTDVNNPSDEDDIVRVQDDFGR
ncbi:cupin domain-containing protein [Flavobacterium laiguense]|uniref:Phosphoheptose isomerase n=1 Tax=Flavobacterium laiguense TaxID=2169409 RepID=A0A2U1JXI3_9FLAO|nr:phosphoheptose isomerase [Flavobacterium laiguense]PWA09920.1 phosphoheptose isomerase [Flavobacterium laiguense]